MGRWYKVSLVGWLVTLVHLALSVLIIRGFLIVDAESPEMQIFYGAFYCELLLFAILVYARFKKHKLFAG